jgi:hypothetical protein
MVGMDAATRLSFCQGSCIVELPSCYALGKAYLADHAIGESDGGANTAEIAHELGGAKRGRHTTGCRRLLALLISTVL